MRSLSATNLAARASRIADAVQAAGLVGVVVLSGLSADLKRGSLSQGLCPVAAGLAASRVRPAVHSGAGGCCVSVPLQTAGEDAAARRVAWPERHASLAPSNCIPHMKIREASCADLATISMLVSESN